MDFGIENKSSKDLSSLDPYLRDFYSFSKERLGFDEDISSMTFISDSRNAEEVLGKTAYYDPEALEVVIYVDERHPKDIMRSISHELVHHAQNCRGEFTSTNDIGEEGYAQSNPHLREMEKEAYLLGSVIYFRDWEDHYKMSENILREWKKIKGEEYVEIVPLLLERKESIEPVSEGGEDVFAPSHYCAHHVQDNITEAKGFVVDHTWNEKEQKINFYDVNFGDHVVENIPVGELTVLEAVTEEGHEAHTAKRDPEEEEKRKRRRTTTEDNEKVEQKEEQISENAFKDSFTKKNEMLYETLMKKWIK